MAEVQDPALKTDLVTAGMIAGVELAGDRAQIAVELTTPACPSKDAIAKAIQDAVGRLPGVAGADVKFSSKVRGRPNRPDNPRLPGVKNIIAVAAGKGGVGKSTVSTNLAAALAAQGASVGIMDADVYGPSIPQMMGDPERPGQIDAGNKIIPAIHHGMKVVSIGFFVERGGAVIWRGPMVHKLLQQFLEDVHWGELDYMVVDLPPGTGDAQLSLSQLLPITGAVMVTTPQEVSIIDVEKALSMWTRVEVPVLGLIENMSGFVCPSCGHHEEIFAARRRPQAGPARRPQVPGRHPARARGQPRRRRRHADRRARSEVEGRRDLRPHRRRRRLPALGQELALARDRQAQLQADAHSVGRLSAAHSRR